MREDSAGKNPAGGGCIDAPSSGTAGHKNGGTAKVGKRDALLDAEGAEDAVEIRDACKVREAYRGAAPEVLQSISSLMAAEDANADGLNVVALVPPPVVPNEAFEPKTWFVDAPDPNTTGAGFASSVLESSDAIFV